MQMSRCKEVDFVKRLPKVETFEQASIKRLTATNLKDIEFLTRVSGGNVIAIKA